MNNILKTSAILLGSAFIMSSCHDDNNTPDTPNLDEPDGAYVGQAVDGFSADEWHPGGELGTTDNISSNSYEDPTPAVTQQGLNAQFQLGDQMASTRYTINTGMFKGWGPVASRKACEDCHPNGYGHAHSRDNFRAETGNGYIVSIYYPDAPGSNNGEPVDQLTTFTMSYNKILNKINGGVHIYAHNPPVRSSGLTAQPLAARRPLRKGCFISWKI